jgi:hypothetical protein
LLPHRRRTLAGAALKAVDAAHPQLDGAWGDLVAARVSSSVYPGAIQTGR